MITIITGGSSHPTIKDVITDLEEQAYDYNHRIWECDHRIWECSRDYRRGSANTILQSVKHSKELKLYVSTCRSLGEAIEMAQMGKTYETDENDNFKLLRIDVSLHYHPWDPDLDEAEPEEARAEFVLREALGRNYDLALVRVRIFLW